MLTTSALNGIKEYIRKTISYAMYKVGSTYYRAPISSTEVDTDGKVVVSVTITHESAGSITVSEIQLYDNNGQLWLSKAESVSRTSVQEGILYRFRFTITES